MFAKKTLTEFEDSINELIDSKVAGALELPLEAKLMMAIILQNRETHDKIFDIQEFIRL